MNLAINLHTHRRVGITGGAFTHALKREAANYMRRRSTGQVSNLDRLAGSVSIPGIGGHIPGVGVPMPTPGAETPLPPVPGAETPLPPIPGAETPLPTPGAEIPVPQDLAPAAEKPARKPRKKAGTPLGESDEVFTHGSTSKAEPETSAAAEPEVSEEAKKAAAEKRKFIGRAVSWKAFGSENTGKIAHVIPAGTTPRAMNILAGGETAKARDHVSYVIEKDDGTMAWPVAKSLEILKG